MGYANMTIRTICATIPKISVFISSID